ncbi:DUF4082 domain-containing protein [Micromonospora sp. FIMYZ51]|uniref:N,N-dimethylformamidase beta subunit family domain-containing protein n=1 Tax=Micromonospora sp. FIMYZ51 TaxID=3051832 RepID=UPI00311E1EE5
MARYWYGATLTDWTLATTTVAGQPAVVTATADVPVTFWTAEVGGTQYTDLLDAGGQPVVSVLSASGDARPVGTIPPVQGPDGVRHMWASAGGGPRLLMAGRVDAVDRAGDTMTGPLTLVDGSLAASERYVDEAVAAVEAADVGAAPAVHGHTVADVDGLAAQLAHLPAAWRWDGTEYVPADGAGVYAGPTDPGDVADGSLWVGPSVARMRVDGEWVDFGPEGGPPQPGDLELAAADRPVVAGQTVDLDVTVTGLASGETVTDYSWTVQSGGGSLTGTTTATPTYTAPSGQGSAVLRVEVATSLGGSDLLDVTVAYGPTITAAENALPGVAREVWDLPVGTLGGVSTLQGFADGFSFNRDETVAFKIGQSDNAGWTADVYRLGWYGGDGARHYATLTPNGGQLSASQAQPQPGDVDPVTDLPSLDCDTWSTTLTWDPPAWAPSGVYVLRLNRTGGGASHVMFVLRDDARTADLMVMPSDSTWVAYNAFGGLGASQYAGNSLYYGTAVNQYASDCARYVSYNRPLVNRGACDPGREYGEVRWSTFFTGEYPMVRFLERNGFDVKYYACIDAAGDPDGALLDTVSAALAVGHNEYWSDGMRAGWEAAKAAGRSLFFSAGNEVFWRLVGHDIDSSGRPRTWECYKTNIDNRESLGRDEWTGTWRDPRGDSKGGAAPENTLTGTIFVVNGPDLRSLVVPHDGGYSQTPLWRHTEVADLTFGQSWTSPAQIVGFEWDVYGPEGVSSAAADYLADPHPDAVYCSDVTYEVTAGKLLTDAGAGYDGSGTATHRLVVHPSSADGGLTFGTGTVNWALGLDSANTYQQGDDNTSDVIQQATINILADMGVAAATLMSGLAEPTPVDWFGDQPGGEDIGEALTMATPAGGTDHADDPITIGTKFAVTTDGSWTGVRVWVTPTAPGVTPSIAAYNHDTGARLAVQAYTEPGTRGGWYDVEWEVPIPVVAGTTYQAAVWTDRYGYSPLSGMTLPLTSESERIYTSAAADSVAAYTYGETPAADSWLSTSTNFMHVSPIVLFP